MDFQFKCVRLGVTPCGTNWGWLMAEPLTRPPLRQVLENDAKTRSTVFFQLDAYGAILRNRSYPFELVMAQFRKTYFVEDGDD